MDAIQTDTIIYKILNENREYLNLTGGIFTAGEIPDNSEEENIVINNISFEHSTPKKGISNVNIHVPDLQVNINDIQQYKANRERLQELSQKVLFLIDSTIIRGVNLRCESQQLFAEQAANEHYLNLRFSWLIANPFITDLDITKQPLIEKIKSLEERLQYLENQLRVNNQDNEPEEPTEQEPTEQEQTE